MVIPGWIEAALGEVSESAAHLADMAELSHLPLPHMMVWPPSQVVELYEERDPLHGAVVRRIHERGLRAIEHAGRLYQEAYEAWEARCATTR